MVRFSLSESEDQVQPLRQGEGPGRAFHRLAAALLATHFGVEFEMNYPIPIGDPPKKHKFDLVSSDRHLIGECTDYTWTRGNNPPSAKIGHINEAAFYLTFLPLGTIRFITLRQDLRLSNGMSLADHYFATNRHLLGDIFLIEIDVEKLALREIRRSS